MFVFNLLVSFVQSAGNRHCKDIRKVKTAGCFVQNVRNLLELEISRWMTVHANAARARSPAGDTRTCNHGIVLRQMTILLSFTHPDIVLFFLKKKEKIFQVISSIQSIEVNGDQCCSKLIQVFERHESHLNFWMNNWFNKWDPHLIQVDLWPNSCL